MKANVIAGIAAVVVVLSGPRGAAQDPPAQFRSTSEIVLVSAGVTDKSGAVRGLTAADFELRDNGVKQTIDAITVDEVPLDLSVILDVSDSVEASVEAFKTEVRAIATSLQARDRFRIVTFGTDIELTVPLHPAHEPKDIGSIANLGGATALNDALLYTMLQPVDPGRRHVVVAFTDALDNWSWLEPTRLPAAAGRSEASINFVLSETDAHRMFGSLLKSKEFTRTIEMPRLTTDPSIVESARKTGGRIYDVTPNSSIAAQVARVLDDERQSYVLAYTPRGVKSEGWHDLDVRVPKAKGAEVRSRQGYSRGK